MTIKKLTKNIRRYHSNLKYVLKDYCMCTKKKTFKLSYKIKNKYKINSYGLTRYGLM